MMTPQSPPPTLAMRLAVHSCFDKPWVISEAGLTILLRIAELSIPASAHADYDDATEINSGSTYKVKNGIAIVPVNGPLLRRDSYISRYLGVSTYESLRRMIGHALTNPQVKGILLDIDSPGGESSGCADLCDFIYAGRAMKPIYACSNDSCYSAAYWIASAAKRLYVTRDGGCGSIGCYMLHLDQSGFDAKAGLKFTYIRSGKHKVDGNAHEPITPNAQNTLQTEVDRVRDLFVAHVARNRAVDAKDVYATEAGVRFSSACLPLLADEIGSYDDCLRGLIIDCGGDPDDAMGSDLTDDYLGDLTSTTSSAASPLWVKDEMERSVIARMLASIPAGYILAAPKVTYPEQAKVCLPVVRRSAMNVGADGDSRKISMLVCPYNSLSVDLGGFKEIYSPGCFSDGGLDQDPRVVWNHDPTLILGRQSASNAKFYETPVGVKCDVELPDISYADDLLTLIRQRIIRESSAAFWILKFRWETRNGERIRVVEKALLREASPVSFAAYKSATVTAQEPQ